MRNLKRLVAADIPSPAPVLIKNNVLVMDFLGKAGWPAPRLRDVQLGPKKMKVMNNIRFSLDRWHSLVGCFGAGVHVLVIVGALEGF